MENTFEEINCHDPEHSTSNSLHLTGDHHEYFAIDADGLVTVQNGALLDRETLATVVLRVVATDKAPENNRHQSSVPVGCPISLCLSLLPLVFNITCLDICYLELPQGNHHGKGSVSIIQSFPVIIQSSHHSSLPVPRICYILVIQ